MLSSVMRCGIVVLLCLTVSGCFGKSVRPIKVEPCPVKMAEEICEEYVEQRKPYIWTWADYLKLKQHYKDCRAEAINNRERRERCEDWLEDHK